MLRVLSASLNAVREGVESMPSIIPDPGSAPGVAPMTTPINGNYVVDSGAVLYVTTIDRVFTGFNAEVTNNGLVWLENGGQNLHAWFDTGGSPSIVNNGFIYIHGDFQEELSPQGEYLQNTGTIYGISDSGVARIIGWAANSADVENSGLIAAQELGIGPDAVGEAIAISSDGRVHVVNHAGGQILAEAPELAIAVYGCTGQPTDPALLTNAGLIEANATAADGVSVGLYVPDHVFAETIANSGTIRADFAIYNGDSTRAGAVELVHNEAGGVLDGNVDLGHGNDQFINDGLVTGNVDMGADADIYSGSGSVSGVVDMGFDDDSYSGSAGDDRATGGRGDDILHGGDGNDLLLGGFGDDTLYGDAGNDGLVGEWGDDVITTSGGDHVEGNSGDDRVILGDYSFESVDGGAGFDTLTFAAGPRDFDLSAILASGRVSSFEALELNGDKQLTVRASDVDALTGATETLRIVGSATDAVELVGSWTHGADQTIDRNVFHSYSLNGRTVLVSAAAAVDVVGSSSTGGGLDPVAWGDGAPHPGDFAGLDYTDPVVFVPGFTLDTPVFTVDAQETFYSNGQAVFYDDSSSPNAPLVFTNNGEIDSLDDAYPSAQGLELHGPTSVINNGLIDVEEYAADRSVYYASIGIHLSAGGIDNTRVQNTGQIFVYSAPGSAIGVNNAGTFSNSGEIDAISEYSRAIGVNGVWASYLMDGSQRFINTGLIYAEAGGFGGQSHIQDDGIVPTRFVATGVAALNSVTNDGKIVAVLGANADPNLETVGVYVVSKYADPKLHAGVTNNGLIEGSVAIEFAEDLTSAHDEWVINNGQILGDVEFWSGNDSYQGLNGQMAGTVFGFGGNDTFAGGIYADSFDGGDGKDTLTGNGGNDTLDGGSGADTMAGGTGDDTYVVDDAHDHITENAGEGTDTVRASTSFTLAANVENLVLTGSADLFAYGNDIDNVLTGNSGSNKLIGIAGNDTLDGGIGNDRLIGGTGDDLYRVDSYNDAVIENAGEGNDTVISTADFTLRANVENLTLSGSDSIWGYGNELDNALTGNGGVNKLFGLAGNDTLDGKGGADRMWGGTGDDRYYVDNYSDHVIENAGEGTDSVFASTNYKLSANVEDLTITGFSNLWAYGNDGDNVVTGNAGANKLYGMGGNDTLNGGGGSDWLEGGAGQDKLTGGTGADNFVFRDGGFGGVTTATADRITDFTHGEDHIRLNFVDANAGFDGDQAFAFMGTAAFDGHAGELRYEQVSGNTYVSGDTNGDGVADFMIRLDGLHTFASGDFVL
jgi:Ca2+-binding RTX toxin-like protein